MTSKAVEILSAFNEHAKCEGTGKKQINFPSTFDIVKSDGYTKMATQQLHPKKMIVMVDNDCIFSKVLAVQMARKFEKRSIALIYIYSILTLGLYFLYWEIKTKNEMNKTFHADIPTGWLLIIPLVNIYWLYRYTECFVTKVKGEKDVALWFLVFFIAGIIMPWIVQTELNNLVDNPQLIQKKQQHVRRCPNCGRKIPFDARICPYCAKNFETHP